MNLKYFQITLLFFITLFLVACSVASKFEIYNNTGVEITLTLNKGDYSASYNIKPAGYITLDYWDLPNGVKATVNSNNFSWEFLPKYVDHSFAKRSMIPSYNLFKLQIDLNGTVYVVAPESDFPAQPHAEQPKFYPLQTQN
ncbi:hypothetical protein GCM10008027_12000 [Pseudoalteromonas gelatinilytica]|uniref:Lipoprotein n=2 Tax=Pseudoalteromonas gelatinilytica TaxID=1703256 RepID=A0ABQ1T9S2_9GAMM|nr:hypothetical protein GCM10008027_12000 [Pseudoalteromonas profundi]